MLKLEENLKYKSSQVNKAAIPVVLQTMHNVILGEVHTHPVVRLIDDLNNADHFIALTNAKVFDISGVLRYRTRFMSVNRDHIIYLIPKDEIIPSQKPEISEAQNGSGMRTGISGNHNGGR